MRPHPQATPAASPRPGGIAPASPEDRPRAPGRVQALLFDVGNVVIDIDFGRCIAQWVRHSRLPASEVGARFAFDAPYRAHEQGQLAAAAYFEHLREVLQLDCTAAEVQAGWNAVFGAAIGPTLALVDQVRSRVRCFALTNTNAAHLAHMRSAYAPVLARFERVFASNEMGARKPDARAFLHVCETAGVAPQAVLFFDDLPENVEGALACGLDAALVARPDDVLRALQARGVLARDDAAPAPPHT